MKLQAKSSRELLKVLQKSSKCVAVKNTISILDHVLLTENAEGEFLFTSSNGDAQLTLAAPITMIDGKLTQSIALPVGLITPFLSTLPDCAITMTLDICMNTLLLEYCTGKEGNVKEGKVSLTYKEGYAFPLLRTVSDKVTHIVLPRTKFETIVANATDFAPRNDLRPILESLCIDIADDLSDLTFAATNAQLLFRMVYSNNPERGGSNFFVSGEPSRMLVSSRYFRIFSVFDDCETIDIESDDRTIRFSSGSMELLCKATEGRYPNYKAVIPASSPYFISFDKKEMLGVLKRVGLFSDKNSNKVILKKDGLFLDIKTQDIDYSIAAEDQVILTDAQCEDGFGIGFNLSMLTSCIEAIDSDEIRMQLIDSSHAALMMAHVPAPDTITLCMPVLFND